MRCIWIVSQSLSFPTVRMGSRCSGMNMGALQGLLLRSDQADSVISELVQKLMYGMSTWESDVVRTVFLQELT